MVKHDRVYPEWTAQYLPAKKNFRQGGQTKLSQPEAELGLKQSQLARARRARILQLSWSNSRLYRRRR